MLRIQIQIQMLNSYSQCKMHIELLLAQLALHTEHTLHGQKYVTPDIQHLIQNYGH
uniref:Uncharacterized protein n=1 Tax=Anguilla anguilla TaxID=7936 RepID=A0A0E9XR91_ANGAN